MSDEVIPANVSALVDAIRRGSRTLAAMSEDRERVRSVVYDVGHAVSLHIAPNTAIASVVPGGHMHVVTPTTLVLFVRGKEYTVCEWHESDSVFPITMKTTDGLVYHASSEASLRAKMESLLSSRLFAELMHKITSAVKGP